MTNGDEENQTRGESVSPENRSRETRHGQDGTRPGQGARKAEGTLSHAQEKPLLTRTGRATGAYYRAVVCRP